MRNAASTIVNRDSGCRTEGRSWSPSSWSSKPVRQQPVYPDVGEYEGVLSRLAQLPPLAKIAEIQSLKARLAQAALGEAFVLQAGPCAERFADCRFGTVARTVSLMHRMSLDLQFALGCPVIGVSRMAGQYAKPRSADFERSGDLCLPSYRGDMVNDPEFSERARRADPNRLLDAYLHARATRCLIRFAECQVDELSGSVIPIWRSKRWRDSSGISGSTLATSHEGLHLGYEQALTRVDGCGETSYDLSTHFPWIGMRTADPDGAHVEFFRGISNPLAVKVGPRMTSECLAELLDRLDPRGEPGRLTLIHRFGAAKIHACLPPLIETVRASGKPALWICDPMHGNTETTSNGFKTRQIENIRKEIETGIAIHHEMGSRLGGIHLELTGDEVAECVGGRSGSTEEDLVDGYESAVDPRLNPAQALEIAESVSA